MYKAVIGCGVILFNATSRYCVFYIINVSSKIYFDLLSRYNFLNPDVYCKYVCTQSAKSSRKLEVVPYYI